MHQPWRSAARLQSHSHRPRLARQLTQPLDGNNARAHPVSRDIAQVPHDAHIIVLQMAPCIRAYPVAAPLIVCGLARVWAAKMGNAVTSSFCKWPHHPASVEVAAESWRFPPLSLQCPLEFTRTFSGAIVQQANS